MKRILISVLLLLSACTWVVQDNRTEEQRSADRTRVAEAPPPLGSVRVELFPSDDISGTVIEEGPTPVPCLDIKGNISQSGEKIYHMQGQANYNNTEIEKEGEAYFCTEKEAQEAGFRKAKN